MKKVIVLTHNPVRDTVTDQCLCASLRLAGFMVWNRGFLDCDKTLITCVKPDIVVLPEIRCEYTVDMAKQCKAWGIQVVVRNCEVGISEESIEGLTDDYKRAVFGSNWPVEKYVDKVLCWGPKMKDMFVKYAGFPEDKVETVGGIAFDQFFIPPPPEKVERTEKKRVMFATGFAYADRNPEYSFPEAKPEDPIHQDVVNRDVRARAAWLTMIKRFWAEYGEEWEIWVKLHPGERGEPYTAVLKDTFAQCPNIAPVRSMMHVDLIVHTGSTMGYEAHLVNKPAINLVNICPDVVVAKVSPNAGTFEEFKVLMDNIDLTKSNADLDVVKQLEEEYYGTADGKGCERAAKVIAELPLNSTDIPDVWPPSKEPIYKTDCILEQVELWSCKACGNKYHVQGPREMVKCPFCGIANVKSMVPV